MAPTSSGWKASTGALPCVSPGHSSHTGLVRDLETYSPTNDQSQRPQNRNQWRGNVRSNSFKWLRGGCDQTSTPCGLARVSTTATTLTTAFLCVYVHACIRIFVVVVVIEDREEKRTTLAASLASNAIGQTDRPARRRPDTCQPAQALEKSRVLWRGGGRLRSSPPLHKSRKALEKGRL